MTVTCMDGTRISELVPVPLGNPGNPMNTGQCRQKFSKCLAYSDYALSDTAREDLFSKIDRLDSLTDINEIIRMMA